MVSVMATAKHNELSEQMHDFHMTCMEAAMVQTEIKREEEKEVVPVPAGDVPVGTDV
jgi:hypothetical protein